MRIFVTGAARGLGSVITRIALEQGHCVYAAVRTITRVPEEWRQFQSDFAEQLYIVEMDVANAKSVTKVSEQLKQNGVQLDGIVNNAAIMIEGEKTIETLDLTAMVESFEVNTVGPMRVIQNLLPVLRKGANQVIINISSEAGTIINAFPTNYPYSMSKTALNMFSERLREYLRPEGIQVYAVHPGWMRTNMGGMDAPADPRDIARGILDIMERKKQIFSKIAFIDATGRPMPL